MNNRGNLPNQASNNNPMGHPNREIKATSTLLKRKSRSVQKALEDFKSAKHSL